jgi:glutamate-ammonia-ligase adenylyltransferase
VAFGGKAARDAVEAAIASELGRIRDPERLRSDVTAMRSEMEAHKPGQGLWDVKLGCGGLVDLEFVTHYLQLRERTALTPDLHDACAALAAQGFLAPAVVDAHDLLTRLLVMLRLVVPDTSGRIEELPREVRELLARSAGHADFASLERALALAKTAVGEAWSTAFGTPRGQ